MRSRILTFQQGWPDTTKFLLRSRSRGPNWLNCYQPATGLIKTSAETSFYLSNRPIDAAQAAAAIRKHWGIENGSHHVRDVTLREDASRIRKNPGIFARIRSFAYNILRFNQRDSVAQDRYAAALGGLNTLLSMNFCNER
jgi:hypothetical protein